MSTRREIAIAVVAGAAGVIAASLGRMWLGALLALACVIATGELLRDARARGSRPAPAVGLAGIIALLVTAMIRGEDAPEAFPIVLAGVVLAAFVAMMARAERVEITRALAVTVLPVVGIGLLAAHVLAIRSARDGMRLSIALLLLALAADLAVRFAANDGGRAVAPDLASVATWEGVAAAVVACLVVGLASRLLLDVPLAVPSAIVLAVVVAVSAPVGEITARSFARDGVLAGGDRAPEDASDGEAGAEPFPVLDRLAGLLLAAPAFFYVFRVMER